MTLPFDIEPRFFNRLTGLRLPVDPATILSVNWEFVEAGGTGQIEAALAAPFETLPAQNGDVIEVWCLNTGETQPRCRGIVATPERGLDLKETHKLIAFGRMEDMNHVLLDKIVVHFEGADLSLYAAEVFSDYLARVRAATGTTPTLLQDIQPVGVSLQQLSATNTTARDALNRLFDQAGANAVWGWDIDPATGYDRFYFRPRTTATVGHQFFIGGNVRLLQVPLELSPVTNALKIQGGSAQYPNLVFNSSFEVPTAPSSATGNLLGDGGFELGLGASAGGPTFLSGGSRNQNTPDVNHAPHTGDWLCVLDHANEEVFWDNIAVTLGTPYFASLYAAQQRASTPTTGTLIVEGRDSSGTVRETYSLTIYPASDAWIGGQGTTVLASDSLSLTVVFTESGDDPRAFSRHQQWRDDLVRPMHRRLRVRAGGRRRADGLVNASPEPEQFGEQDLLDRLGLPRGGLGRRVRRPAFRDGGRERQARPRAVSRR